MKTNINNIFIININKIITNINNDEKCKNFIINKKYKKNYKRI